MKLKKAISVVLMMFCLVLAGSLAAENTAEAKKIKTSAQAKKKAKKKVKNAVVTDVDKEVKKGVTVYEVQLYKDGKEYDLLYRASDGKLMSYEYEKQYIDITSTKKVMSKSACKKLAKKKVKGGKIKSIVKYDRYDDIDGDYDDDDDYDAEDNVPVWKVKMKKDKKTYILVYHGRTREILEYKWSLPIKKAAKKTAYIGTDKAKSIALNKVPGATVVKLQLEKDDGIYVYEVELIKDGYEYELKIDAKTGSILEYDQDRIDD